MLRCRAGVGFPRGMAGSRRRQHGDGGPTRAQADLLRLAYGAQVAQLLYVSARLGLADRIGAGERSAAELARAVGVDFVILRRILRALATFGVLAECSTDSFALTDLGEYLRSDHPDSVQPRVLLNAEVLQPLWGELLHTVRTGESGAQRVLGMPLYEYLTRHPEAGALFDRTMAGFSRYRVRPAVAAYDFGQFGTIVDVGGGDGALMIEILSSYPGPRGVVFDFAAVTERALANIAAAGLTERCTAKGGNALEMVPAGADVYVLSNFLVSLDDDRASMVLRRCREATRASGRLVLIEWLALTEEEIDDPFTRWDKTAIDLTILSTQGAAGGRVRTVEEFETVLDAGGYALREIIPTESSVHVIEAQPA